MRRHEENYAQIIADARSDAQKAVEAGAVNAEGKDAFALGVVAAKLALANMILNDIARNTTLLIGEG